MGQALYALRATDPAESRRRAEAWLAAHPHAPIARHMAPPLMDTAETDGAARAEDGFVKATFDAFAATFDEKLAALDYRGPAVMADLLAGEPGGRRVLDLGCGTGLCAPVLRPKAARLEGIDLSPEMLDRARPLYDSVHEAEAGAFLEAGAPEAWDIITAADMFIYIGALEPLIEAAARAVADDGCLAFTAESLDDPAEGKDWRLNPHGRYAHRAGYLIRALRAAGLVVEALEPVTIRTEAGRPVPALAGRARKAAEGGSTALSERKGMK